jgi:hypothetical protein
MLLLFVGWMITIAQDGYHYETFFSYQVIHLDYMPYWLLAILVLMCVNGWWMFRLARFEGAFHVPQNMHQESYEVFVPVNNLRLFAINLIAIPVIILCFIVIRHLHW